MDGMDANRISYAVNMPCAASGRSGYTVRVLPRHEALARPLDMAMIRWA